jgi:hypothetical protein
VINGQDVRLQLIIVNLAMICWIFFLYFINTEILTLILEHTNNRLTERATKLTIDELKCWIGLLLLFGVTGKNDVEVNSIWSSGPGQIYHSDHATAAMSRDRFKFLCSVITFDDEPSRNAR